MRICIIVVMSPIEHIRKAILGLSQAQLAAIAGVKQSTVSRWEKGELSPSIREVGRVVRASGGKVRADDFIENDQARPPSPAVNPPPPGAAAP